MQLSLRPLLLFLMNQSLEAVAVTAAVLVEDTTTVAVDVAMAVAMADAAAVAVAVTAAVDADVTTAISTAFDASVT